jgi:Domain of unknown function (DUF4389)
MYPVSFEADAALEGRNRLTTFFRYIVAIPWLIVVTLYAIVAEIAAVIAWFAIVFTGRYPEGLYNFNAGFLRMAARVNGFYYLLTDEWPPFGGEEAPNYPIRVGVPEPLGAYDRLKTGLRFIFGIPVYLLALVQSLILGVCAFIAWFAILFTGRLGEGLFTPMRSASAYLTRAGAYFLLITEDWPPFSYEEAGPVSTGQISQEAESRSSQEAEGPRP